MNFSIYGKCRYIDRYLSKVTIDHIEKKWVVAHDPQLARLCRGRTVFVDILYACLRHYHFIDITLFQDGMRTFLQKEHGIAASIGDTLVASIKDELKKSFDYEPFWQQDIDFILYVINIVVSTESDELHHVLGIGDDLLIAISDCLDDSRSQEHRFHDPKALVGMVKPIVDAYVQDKHRLPWHHDNLRLRFIVEPMISSSFADYSQQAGYDWLLACLVTIGERRSLSSADLVNVLRDALAHGSQEVSKSDCQHLLKALIVADIVYETPETKHPTLALTETGYELTAHYFGQTSELSGMQTCDIQKYDRCWQKEWIDYALIHSPEILECLDDIPTAASFGMLLAERRSH